MNQKISAFICVYLRFVCLIFCILPAAVFAQTVPAPKDVLGFTPGDDRKLASWNQVIDYFTRLSKASNRVKFEEIGKSTNGNPFVYATISAPENLKNLDKYKQINAKLADPRLIKSDAKLAQQLIKQGKTIVLITCGVHSSEVGSYLSSMLIADKLATSNEPAIKKILDETIILLVPALNPDGVDIIKNWYDKTLGTPFEGTEPPELYHKYVGHDDNRDWYAFTQIETQLTVDKIHNEWHPQIVNDIHQQGAFGSRLFLPPYLAPVEPNVPPQIVEGYTELGNYIARDLRTQGFSGITTNSTYDAWTPSRAYSHYHGGVRILSETASCKLATPITVEFDKLRGNVDGIGYDAKVESPNFSPVWKGGEWHLRDITNYMTAAAFSLLKNAAANREKWLTRFYAIGKEAVRPRKKGELWGYKTELGYLETSKLLGILERGGVKIQKAGIDKNVKDSEGYEIVEQAAVLIKLAQPYGNFAKALLESQMYPQLLDEKGNPIPPYDVTAHTLPLLFGIEVTPLYLPQRSFKYIPSDNFTARKQEVKGVGLYKSSVPTIDEGWTRWFLENDFPREYKYYSLIDKDLKSADNLSEKKVVIFPDQSPNQMLNGFPQGTMPAEFTGGIGADGVANLKKFVENGGTLVFLNRASDFAIEQFNLPLKDVTKGLQRKDFYIPGSILRTEIDTTSPLAEGMPPQSIAWFENSPAFEVLDNSNVRIIAKYPAKTADILLSGWALGAEKIAGKAALVEIKSGRGKIILFGFRPQYRGQSLATFPLLFNAISN